MVNDHDMRKRAVRRALFVRRLEIAFGWLSLAAIIALGALAYAIFID